MIQKRDVPLWKKEEEKAWRDLFRVMDKVHVANARFSAEEVETEVDASIQELRARRQRSEAQ